MTLKQSGKLYYLVALAFDILRLCAILVGVSPLYYKYIRYTACFGLTGHFQMYMERV
jgi:hypothetical protein